MSTIIGERGVHFVAEYRVTSVAVCITTGLLVGSSGPDPVLRRRVPSWPTPHLLLTAWGKQWRRLTPGLMHLRHINGAAVIAISQITVDVPIDIIGDRVDAAVAE